jgi:UDP-glucose 4-epimerase
MDPMPTTILITGANGFLARAVADQAPAHWRVIGLVRSNAAANGHPRLQRLFDSVESLAAGGEQVDGMLHLAAHIPVDMRKFDPQLVQANIELPARLIRHYPAARHVLASSVSVYGNAIPLPSSVATPAMPATPYGWSKLAAEALVQMTASHAVLRLSSIIGRGMRSGSFVPAMIAAARAGRIEVFGDGSRLQDYIDVRDAARLCIAAAQRSDSFVTLAVSGHARSNAAVARELAGLTGAAVEFSGVDASASSAYTLVGATDLGACRYSLRETLEDMVGK